MTVAQYWQAHPGWLRSGEKGILTVKDEHGLVMFLCPSELPFMPKRAREKAAHWEVVEK